MKNQLLRYQLQFFAKEGAGGEKTEPATTKKLQDARKEGQVARSTELVMAISLLALFLILKIFVGKIGMSLLETYQEMYNLIPDIINEEITPAYISSLVSHVIVKIILIALPVYISSIVIAFAVNIAQVKWQITTKPLVPKFSKFDPVSGFKKMFGKDKLVELAKSVLKITVIVYIAISTLKKEQNTILLLYKIPLYQAIALIGNIIINLGLRISLLFLFIGFGDYLYQKFKFKNDMKMTKQEIKDEYKQSEGDPQIKGKIRGKMREASQRRMMQELPKADVVITNPTHLAVALQYDKETAQAPLVIAKGADYLAEKIKGIAKENKIEIVENKPLARMLYYNVELGAEIPPQLYQMVAEVLAYVYNLKNK